MLRLFLAVCFVSVASFGQEVAIQPRLQAGDTFTVESLRSREDSRTPQSNRRTRTKIDFRVDQMDASGLLLDVVVGESEILEPAGGVNPLVEKLNKAAATIHYKVRLNPGGDYKGIDNQNEVGRQLVGILNELKTAILAELPEAQRAATDRAMRASMEPSLIIASALEDVTIYFKMHGGALPVNQPVVASVAQASPLNGASTLGEMRIEVTKADAKSATIKMQTKPNPEALTALTKQLMSQMGSGADGREVSIQMQEEATYQFDRALGLMTQVDLSRGSEVGPVVRKETWQLKLVTSPKR